MKKSTALTFLSARLCLGGLIAFACVTARAADAMVAADQTVTITVTTDGTDPFTYVWYKNGAALPEETTSAYVINGFQAQHAGVYTAVISNPAGSTSTEEVILTLATPPVFTAQPASQTLLAGEPLTLSVSTTALPAPTYQWRKGGVDLTGATDSTYVIPSTSADDGGVYSVVATNLAGSATSSEAIVTVIIPMPPVITTQPASHSVIAGDSVTFSVVATGTPAPSYQWRKDGVAITGATGASYGITGASTAHAGIYSVEVQNSVGTATSSGATLTVAVVVIDTTKPPVITTQPVSKTVMAGVSTTFSVVATGSPAPTYQWCKNGTAITGATGSTYVIANPKVADAGTYSVVVTNSTGTVTSTNALLSVKPLVHADLDGDGKSDILWENILNGNHRVWLMAGTTKISGLNLSTATTDWEVIGPGEFNADGKTDILLQNMVTREVRVWLMSGITLTSSVSLGIAPVGMYVEGVGDFNADNKTDIIWRNAATNEFSIRLMNGVTAGTSVSLGVRSWGIEVVGTGDFNGDGQTDILWSNPDTGVFGAWYMNGAVYSKWVDLPRQTAGWEAGGTGDFNGDHKPDILWQNASTGARKVALMSGVTVASEVSLGIVVPEWFIRN